MEKRNNFTMVKHFYSGHAIKYKSIAHDVHNNMKVEIQIHFIEYDLEIDAKFRMHCLELKIMSISTIESIQKLSKKTIVC